MKTSLLFSHTALAVALVVAGGAARAADQPPATAEPAPEAAGAEAPGSEIIVTGTRASGITVAESAAPIKLVGAEAISHVGQPNLNQVLTQLVPSFTAESYGGDTANLTLSAALRGLNPNETLILVNGKRRHGTANLHVLPSGFQGSAAPDLDFITPASIDHIEVLEDGAAAQYGSDAIAGVINIILKKKSGGEISATGGQFYAGDGKTYSSSLNYGFTSDRGYLNMTAFYRYHDYSQRGGIDERVTDAKGNLNDSAKLQVGGVLTPLGQAYSGLENFPSVNPVNGDARSKFGVLSYNSGLDITDGVQFYSFGSMGFRKANSYENVRLPDRSLSVATADAGVAGDYNTSVATGNSQYIFSTSGFRPQEAIRERDSQVAGGLKGSSGNFTWDLSTTYGEDRDELYTLHSKNLSLWVDHLTEGFQDLDFTDPANHETYNFYDGTFTAGEWTSNLDLTYKVGDFATLAAGAEYRKNQYSISPGEPSSYFGTAAQSFAGYTPENSGDYHRHDKAFYGDIALTPLTGLKLDGAARYEDYSDFGHKVTWKATGRYDFTPAIAIRGTASTGIRAPTLAEEHYSGINVSPGYNYLQLPPNSAGALALGVAPLKPETSRNYSAGFVFRPAPRFTLTIDAYQIGIKNRIVGSGNIRGYYNPNSETVYDAANIVNPNVLGALLSQAGCSPAADPATCTNVDYSLNDIGVLFFTNGASTRSRGIDAVASYAADLGNAGRATFTLSGNYSKTKVTHVNPTPTSISDFGGSVLDATAISYLTTAQPRFKVIGGVSWSIGDFTVVGRETVYGKSSELLDGNGTGTYIKNTVPVAGITDLELDYNLTPKVILAVGANNLLDKRPPIIKPDINGDPSDGGAVLDERMSFAPYGYDGGYYYVRVDVKF